jgi:protein-disulfide isomerase
MRRTPSIIILIVFACLTFAQAQTAKPARSSQRPKAKPATEQKQTAPADKQTTAQKPAEVKEEDCGCDGDAPADAWAALGGVKITREEIDAPIKKEIEELEKQIVESRGRELALQINTRLLDAEAKKRGITSTKLIEQEILTKVKEPTEAEARAFYDQNRAQIQGEFKDLKPQIIAHLRNQRQSEVAASYANQLRASADVKVLVAEVTPPAKEADRARVFATVNGVNITSGDIEDTLKPLIYEVRDQIYHLRKQQLDMKINDMLVDQEAKKRNTTTLAIFEAEVLQKTKQVTEEDARKFYNENKARINGTFEQVKGQLIQFLQQQEQRNAEMAFAELLRKGAALQIYLREPDPPAFSIAVDDQPMKGSPDAQVTIVEFTDFECPSCAVTQPVLEEVVREYAGKVKLVARDFPLEQHAYAFKAAEAAEAAREQGKYWEYTALLFKNQKALTVDKLKEYATQAGLDRAKFDQALDSGKFASKVQRDLQDGIKIGVNSTPSVFVNGKRVKERTRESLKSAIEAALKDIAKR